MLFILILNVGYKTNAFAENLFSSVQSRAFALESHAGRFNKIDTLLKPPCNVNSYFPLCGKMTFVFDEVDAVGVYRERVITYTYFTSFKKSGKIYYGYSLDGEDDGKGGNIYLNIDNGIITEFYEIPEVKDEYVGTEERWGIFDMPWDDPYEIDHYQRSIKYNTGKFRSIRLLDTKAQVGASWVDETIVDGIATKVMHKVIRKQASLPVKSGDIFKDVIVLERKTVTGIGMESAIESVQEVKYAKGVGIISIIDIDRNHFRSDFVRPNRILKSYELPLPVKPKPGNAKPVALNKSDKTTDEVTVNLLKHSWKNTEILKTGSNKGKALHTLFNFVDTICVVSMNYNIIGPQSDDVEFLKVYRPENYMVWKLSREAEQSGPGYTDYIFLKIDGRWEKSFIVKEDRLIRIPEETQYIRGELLPLSY